MPEIISQCMRKARKKHICDYCREAIEPGEEYEYTALKYDGEFYDWRSHRRCSEIVSEIWDYADPDEGMDEELFSECCHDVCRTFVCPDCENWNTEFEDCELDESYCTKKLADFFQTHEMVRGERKGWGYVWRCIERKQKEGEADGVLSAAAVPQAQ